MYWPDENAVEFRKNAQTVKSSRIFWFQRNEQLIQTNKQNELNEMIPNDFVCHIVNFGMFGIRTLSKVPGNALSRFQTSAK